MKITFLGSGGAFTTTNYHSNILIEENGHKMLFDCGSDIKFSLLEQKISPLDIEAIYISHLHGDHIGGLEYFGFLNYFMKVKKGGERPVLFGDEYIIHDLWEHSLKGGMRSLQTIDANLNTYFNVYKIGSNDRSFYFDELKCKLVQTIHIVADTTFVKSFGLMITTPMQNKVFITSDTQFAPVQICDFISMSDIVFHDCEISEYMSGVHAHYNHLKTLPPEIKKKMWLYHNDGKRPDAKVDGFLGFIDKGQTFEL